MKILLPFDRSASSEPAIRFLEAYQGCRSDITPLLLNVQSPPYHLWPASLPEPVLEEVLLEAAEDIIERPLTQLSTAGYPANMQLRIGNAAATILEVGETCAVDAILMGTRGQGGLPGLIMGSAAMRVVHNAAVPVILVRDGMRMPRSLGARSRILLPVDGSPHGDQAVARAIQWSDWLGISHARILHVTQPITLLETIAPPHRDMIERWGGSGAEQACSYAARALSESGIAYDAAFVASDEVAQCIARHAEESNFDLIIMGTRGLGAVSHAFMGSVSFTVACLSPVPVMLVPASLRSADLAVRQEAHGAGAVPV